MFPKQRLHLRGSGGTDTVDWVWQGILGQSGRHLVSYSVLKFVFVQYLATWILYFTYAKHSAACAIIVQNTNREPQGQSDAQYMLGMMYGNLIQFSTTPVEN